MAWQAMVLVNADSLDAVQDNATAFAAALRDAVRRLHTGLAGPLPVAIPGHPRAAVVSGIRWSGPSPAPAPDARTTWCVIDATRTAFRWDGPMRDAARDLMRCLGYETSQCRFQDEDTNLQGYGVRHVHSVRVTGGYAHTVTPAPGP